MQVAIGMGDDSKAPRISEISKHIEVPPIMHGREKGAAKFNLLPVHCLQDKIKASEIGKGYLQKAQERGMDGDVRLREVVLVLLFAGV